MNKLISSFTELYEVNHEFVKLDFSGFVGLTKKVYEPCERYIGCFNAFAEFEFIYQDSYGFVVRVRHKHQEFGKRRLYMLEQEDESPKLMERGRFIHAWA